MAARAPQRSVLVTLLLAALVGLAELAGCGTDLLPGDPVLPAGHRQWIVTVENDSAEPVRLLVAEDLGRPGEEVGSVDPPQVPANTTQDVVITVPPGQGWAFFVNPTGARGPLIVPPDVPEDFEGRMPITIHVGGNGEPSFSHQGDLPGWFGQ